MSCPSSSSIVGRWNCTSETLPGCGRSLMNARAFRIKKLVPNLTKTLLLETKTEGIISREIPYRVPTLPSGRTCGTVRLKHCQGMAGH